MTNNSLDRIVSILAKQTATDMSSVTAETPLETLGIDSFDFIEFVFMVEDEFGIQININYNEFGSRLKTVGDVAAAVDDLVSAKEINADRLSSAVPA